MGVLAPGSVHARPSARPPIDTSGHFSAHVSAESTSPPPAPQMQFPLFRTPTATVLKFFLFCPPKLGFFEGVGGSPK